MELTIKNINEFDDIILDNDGLEKIVNYGFDKCFYKKNDLVLFVNKEILIVPGQLFKKNEFNHDCFLFSINGKWVWESEKMLEDKIIYKSNTQRSVTLIKINEGDSINFIAARKSSNKHLVKKIINYKYINKNFNLEKNNQKNYILNH
jgi:hypothetical protein